MDTIQKEIYISNANSQNTTITFDKGIYKPGDTVKFRALLTSKEDDKPVVKETNISIYDGNDNRVYNENAKASDYGIISGEFKLANEVNSGIYKLVVKTETNETTKQFKVNPYITPKYEIKINTDKNNYLVNETATINIGANYFFGEPVSEARYTVYINGKIYQTVSADQNGLASLSYKIEEAKTYTIKVEAVDSSNYFVEETTSFTAGTDLFEISLLPEYGDLIANEKNEIYVLTNTADGKPVKTYITVSSGKFTKQVATDENGIGKFSIDIENTNNSYRRNSTQIFSVTAENMNGERVQKNITLPISYQKLLLSTDKLKYNQGEDIKLKVSSQTESVKNIYFFKNDKLIKIISTDLESTTINLDDVYGLIDIYLSTGTNTSSYMEYYNSKSNLTNRSSSSLYKKTIFIKPQKELNIDIQTDKGEYAPGENITISFGTKDEKNNEVESALLVSMLDNSILSLADNDLSIDNIKLALQDINFSNDLDAVTLYSNIIDDKSEQTMMALLLKQGNKDIKLSESIIRNYEEEEKAQTISIVLIVILVIIAITYLCVKFRKFRNIAKHVLNATILIIIVLAFTGFVMEEYLYDLLYDWREGFEWCIPVFAIISSITIYILVISKIEKKITRTSISIIISYGILMALAIIIGLLRISIFVVLLAIAILVLILAIISKVYKKKNDKYAQVIKKEVIYILKFIASVGVSILIGLVLQGAIENEFFAILALIVGVYFFNALFNELGKEENIELTIEKNKKTVVSIVVIIIIILAIIGLGGIIYSVISNLSNSLNDGGVVTRIEETNRGVELDSSTYTQNTDRVLENIKNGGAVANSAESKNVFSLDKIINNADAFLNTKDNNNAQNESTNIAEEYQDNNIRNVFLESMCFIPELITTNGRANLNLKLSDNITTWTIQTIGNTKDGKIGYNKLDTVKVFKDFFVDFELPKNLVETDKVSIPVTVYNYTKNPLTTILNIKEEDWFKLNEANNIEVSLEAETLKMVYVPITILKTGNNKFRVEANANSQADIIEKEANVLPKGYKVEKVVSSGNLEGKEETDILILENILENTASAKVKIYASPMAQTIEGMENIFKMPTGCFEQISSTLYPNILALKYMEDNGIVNEELKQKALNYISSGYQKLLTYEVKGESGGYSLYGDSPAETVLTAYGLMELMDLKQVYKVDEKVTEKMRDFLYKKQNINGSFTITGHHRGGAATSEELALNAYITWALSESDAKNEKLKKSIDYLKGKLDKIEDNYTLALVANALANVGDKEAENVIKRLVNNININESMAYITSNIVDYYGSRNNSQTTQTVALTSMALSKMSKNKEVNKQLVNYLISKKDLYGTWYSTQATILSLKALNELNDKNKLEDQTVRVKVNSEEKEIQIQDNPLELYELSFGNLGKENKLSIELPKGSAYYEVVTEYYIPYENVNKNEDKIEVNVEANNNLKVNEILDAKIRVINKDKNSIYNGMVTISIPQGFATVEESLMLLQTKGIIEKYETTYNTVNIYLRNFEPSNIVNLNVKFRALYPVEITGLATRVYDYYNPEVEGKSLPIGIVVSD